MIGRINRRLFLPVLLVLTLVAAGCGSGDEGAPATQSADQDSNDAGSGDGAGSAPSSGDLPASVSDGFPVDIPGGWEIDIQGEIGMTNTASAQLLYPADAYDSIVAFYDDWTESQSDEYARTEVGDQVIYTGIESGVFSITVTPDEEQRDQTWTLLQVITSGE